MSTIQFILSYPTNLTLTQLEHCFAILPGTTKPFFYDGNTVVQLYSDSPIQFHPELYSIAGVTPLQYPPSFAHAQFTSDRITRLTPVKQVRNINMTAQNLQIENGIFIQANSRRESTHGSRVNETQRDLPKMKQCVSDQRWRNQQHEGRSWMKESRRRDGRSSSARHSSKQRKKEQGASPFRVSNPLIPDVINDQISNCKNISYIRSESSMQSGLARSSRLFMSLEQMAFRNKEQNVKMITTINQLRNANCSQGQALRRASEEARILKLESQASAQQEDIASLKKVITELESHITFLKKQNGCLKSEASNSKVLKELQSLQQQYHYELSKNQQSHQKQLKQMQAACLQQSRKLASLQNSKLNSMQSHMMDESVTLVTKSGGQVKWVQNEMVLSSLPPSCLTKQDIREVESINSTTNHEENRQLKLAMRLLEDQISTLNRALKESKDEIENMRNSQSIMAELIEEKNKTILDLIEALESFRSNQSINHIIEEHQSSQHILQIVKDARRKDNGTPKQQHEQHEQSQQSQQQQIQFQQQQSEQSRQNMGSQKPIRSPMESEKKEKIYSIVRQEDAVFQQSSEDEGELSIEINRLLSQPRGIEREVSLCQFVVRLRERLRERYTARKSMNAGLPTISQMEAPAPHADSIVEKRQQLLDSDLRERVNQRFEKLLGKVTTSRINSMADRSAQLQQPQYQHLTNSGIALPRIAQSVSTLMMRMQTMIRQFTSSIDTDLEYITENQIINYFSSSMINFYQLLIRDERIWGNLAQSTKYKISTKVSAYRIKNSPMRNIQHSYEDSSKSFSEDGEEKELWKAMANNEEVVDNIERGVRQFLKNPSDRLGQMFIALQDMKLMNENRAMNNRVIGVLKLLQQYKQIQTNRHQSLANYSLNEFRKIVRLPLSHKQRLRYLNTTESKQVQIDIFSLVNVSLKSSLVQAGVETIKVIVSKEHREVSENNLRLFLTVCAKQNQQFSEKVRILRGKIGSEAKSKQDLKDINIELRESRNKLTKQINQLTAERQRIENENGELKAKLKSVMDEYKRKADGTEFIAANLRMSLMSSMQELGKGNTNINRKQKGL